MKQQRTFRYTLCMGGPAFVPNFALQLELNLANFKQVNTVKNDVEVRAYSMNQTRHYLTRSTGFHVFTTCGLFSRPGTVASIGIHALPAPVRISSRISYCGARTRRQVLSASTGSAEWPVRGNQPSRLPSAKSWMMTGMLHVSPPLSSARARVRLGVSGTTSFPQLRMNSRSDFLDSAGQF